MEHSKEFALLQELTLSIDLYRHIHDTSDKSIEINGDVVICESEEEEIESSELEITDDDIYAWKVCNLSEIIALSIIKAFLALNKRIEEFGLRLPVVELADINFDELESELDYLQDYIDKLCQESNYYSGDDLQNIWHLVQKDLIELNEKNSVGNEELNFASIDYYKSKTFAVTKFICIVDERIDKNPSISQFIKEWYSRLVDIIRTIKANFLGPSDSLVEKFISERVSLMAPDCLFIDSNPSDNELMAMPKSKRIEKLEQIISNILHPQINNEHDLFWSKCVEFCFDTDSGEIDIRSLGHFLIKHKETLYANYNSPESNLFHQISNLKKYKLLLEQENGFSSNKKNQKSKNEELTLASYFKDKTKADQYCFRLKQKVHDILEDGNNDSPKEAMLYFYACEVGGLLGQKKVPIKIIEGELGIKKTSYSNYRKGGKLCNYKEGQYLEALKYIKNE